MGGSVSYVLIPTKTSRLWNQLSGSVPLQFSNNFFHVSSALQLVSSGFVRCDSVCCESLVHRLISAVLLLVVSAFPRQDPSHPHPCNVAGHATGLFPYGGRESWHA
jgi:hypothetical protein